ncbi:MAG: aminopeptidase [Treponema sp.]|jgi:predicted aminopeptidase|nr:aminopeptidase [Treponema sp.]
MAKTITDPVLLKKAPAVWFYSNIPSFAAAGLFLAVVVLCSGCYTLKQGTTMLGYLGRAAPLEDLGGEGASEEDRRFAARVESIRRFAMEELGLKESKNYTRYVELDRDYLAAVVSASAQDSFTPYEWWFPVVGKVPYKGFFNVEDARKEREKLRKKGLDVWIRTVDAFSTLGWFRDPLYSYMKAYSDRELADLIIHELFHATVFIKDHVQFNEGLAEFVGSEGARLYIAKTFGPEAEKEAGEKAAGARTDNAAYVDFIRGLIAELNAVYTSADLSKEDKLRKKEEIIAAARIRFEQNYDAIFVTENYRGFSQLPVNNAYLGLFCLYYQENTLFKDLYERSGHDLPAFIAAAKSVKGKEDPRVEFERALGL